jgi:deoxyinosine 3'endonuclease (endonuclease V)
VNVAQAVAAHTGVDLRRGEIGMAKHFLHRSQVGATVQKMSGERVP